MNRTEEGFGYERSYNDGLLEIKLMGEIDHHSAVGVRVELDREILALRPRKLVFDLSEIRFMDSSGLGLVMGRYAKMQSLGGEVTVRGGGARVKKIFELAGLDKKIRYEEV